MSEVLQFDMCTKLRKQFADWRAEAEQQAADTAKAAEQERYRASYAERHTPETPDAA